MKLFDPQTCVFKNEGGKYCIYVKTFFDKINIKAANYKIGKLNKKTNTIEVELYTAIIPFLSTSTGYIHPIIHAIDLSELELSTDTTIEVSIYNPIRVNALSRNDNNGGTNGNGASTTTDTPKPKKAGSNTTNTASADEDLRPINIA